MKGFKYFFITFLGKCFPLKHFLKGKRQHRSKVFLVYFYFSGGYRQDYFFKSLSKVFTFLQTVYLFLSSFFMPLRFLFLSPVWCFKGRKKNTVLLKKYNIITDFIFYIRNVFSLPQINSSIDLPRLTHVVLTS